LKVTDVNSPVICDRTDTVWNASAAPMTLMAIGIAFWTAVAVVTGTAALGWLARPVTAGADCTASLPEQARDTTGTMSADRAQVIRTKLPME